MGLEMDGHVGCMGWAVYANVKLIVRIIAEAGDLKLSYKTSRSQKDAMPITRQDLKKN